jgi:hypothetical protein
VRLLLAKERSSSSQKPFSRVPSFNRPASMSMNKHGKELKGEVCDKKRKSRGIKERKIAKGCAENAIPS